MRAKTSTQHRPHRQEPSAPPPPTTGRVPTTGPVTDEELELARRNHSAPL